MTGTACAGGVLPRRARSRLTYGRLQVWDNNHHRDFHTLVEKDIDRETFEEETYKRLLAETLDHDTESANRAGATCPPPPSRAGARLVGRGRRGDMAENGCACVQRGRPGSA